MKGEVHSLAATWPRRASLALIAAALLAGLTLRLWQFLAGASMFVDEAAVSRIVLERSWTALLGPLDYGQSAPAGYLLLTRLFASVAGESEFALRAVALLSGIAALGLFPMLAREVLRPFAAAVATFLFASAVPLVFFTAAVKQYSTDVAVVLAILLASSRLLRPERLTARRALWMAAAIVPAVFLSHAAIFCATGAGAVLAIEAVVRRREDLPRRLIVVGAWAAACLAASLRGVAITSAMDRMYLEVFWTNELLPRSGALSWLFRNLVGLFGGPRRPWTFDAALRYPWPVVAAALSLAGCLTLCLFRRARGTLVIAPLAFVLLASAAHLFPFVSRASLFLVPLLLVAVVSAVDEGSRVLLRLRGNEAVCALLLPVAAVASIRNLPPRQPEHLRPLLQQLTVERRPSEPVWVYYGAGGTFLYYSRRLPLRENVIFSECDRQDVRAILRQTDVLRGKPRVWIVFAHGVSSRGFDERALLRAYFDALGIRLQSMHAPPDDRSPVRAEVLLYDFSDPGRLASISADTFPARSPQGSGMWSCYGTMSPFGARPAVLDALRRRHAATARAIAVRTESAPPIAISGLR